MKKSRNVGGSSRRCQHVEGTKKCKRVGDTVAKNGKLYCNTHLVEFNKSKVDLFNDKEPEEYCMRRAWNIK